MSESVTRTYDLPASVASRIAAAAATEGQTQSQWVAQAIAERLDASIRPAQAEHIQRQLDLLKEELAELRDAAYEEVV